MKRKKKQEVNRDKEVKCPECERILKNGAGLAGHLRMVHGVEVKSRREPLLLLPVEKRLSVLEESLKGGLIALRGYVEIALSELEDKVSGNTKIFDELLGALKHMVLHLKDNDVVLSKRVKELEDEVKRIKSVENKQGGYDKAIGWRCEGKGGYDEAVGWLLGEGKG